MIERRIWLALAAVCAAGGVIQLPWAPSRFGGVFLLALSVGCAGEWLMLRLRDRHKACRVLSIVGRVLFGLFLVSFIAIQGVIMHGMQPDPESADAEYLLVLGARVNPDGQPSAALAARLDTAYDFMQEHPDVTAILCGGHGWQPPAARGRVEQHDTEYRKCPRAHRRRAQDSCCDERLPPRARPRAHGARRAGRLRHPCADALSRAVGGGAVPGVLLDFGADAHRPVGVRVRFSA